MNQSEKKKKEKKKRIDGYAKEKAIKIKKNNYTISDDFKGEITSKCSCGGTYTIKADFGYFLYICNKCHKKGWKENERRKYDSNDKSSRKRYVESRTNRW